MLALKHFKCIKKVFNYICDMTGRKKFVYNEAVEAIAKKARVATTNEELADVCEQLNVADEVFLGKVDFWLAKSALSTVYRTLKKYPLLREDIHYFGTLNGFIKSKEALFKRLNPSVSDVIVKMIQQSSDEVARSCLAAFRSDGLALAFVVAAGNCRLSGIIINGKSMAQKDVLQNLKYGEQSGHSPKGCNSIKSVIEHEIGHLLDLKLGISDSFEFKRIMSAYDAPYIYSNLSHYAASGNTIREPEVVAEAYSEYCNNPAPREIALRVGRLIDQKYKSNAFF